jgi:hypothetical protein
MMMRTLTMPITMRGVQVSAAFWCVIRTLDSPMVESVTAAVRAAASQPRLGG